MGEFEHVRTQKEGLLRCPGCPATLGEWRADGQLVQRYRGRVSVGRISAIVCDRCGQLVTLGTGDQPAA